jgi:hypothetical protein
MTNDDHWAKAALAAMLARIRLGLVAEYLRKAQELRK